MFRIYFCGLCVLIIAIIVNVLVKKIGVLTWYDFVTIFLDNGFQSLIQVGLLSFCWLFIVYPLTLGLTYFLADKLYNLF
jgi:hypothetical protein|tara:strand:+ start:23071 stop:23307 length:237 start_codon:yes stop_codon:yes gene_type:complete